MTLRAVTGVQAESRDVYEVALELIQSAPGLLPPHQRLSLEALAQTSAQTPGIDAKTLWKKLPTATKSDVFGNTTAKKSWLADSLKRWSKLKRGLRLIPGAGSSPQFLSFRSDAGESESSSLGPMTDLMLQAFGVDAANTIVVQAYPASLHLPSHLNVADLGPRLDLLKPALPTLLNSFENLIFVAQPDWLHRAVATGTLPPEYAKRYRFALGGTHVPASLPLWLVEFLGESPEFWAQRMVSLYGLSELGLGVGFTLPGDAAHRLTKGTNGEWLPQVFRTPPNRTLFENLGDQILVTDLRPDSWIRLARYQTGDDGSYDPTTGLLTIRGRLKPSSACIRAEVVLDILHASPEIARNQFSHTIVRSNEIQIAFGKEIPPTHTRRLIENELQASAIRPVAIEWILVHETRFDVLRKPKIYE